MKTWGLIIKAAGITGVLLVVRLVFDYLNLNVLSVTSSHHCIHRCCDFYDCNYLCRYPDGL